MRRTVAVASSGCVVAAVEATSTISFTSAIESQGREWLYELFRRLGHCWQGEHGPQKGTSAGLGV